jgi:hypothetical protein
MDSCAVCEGSGRLLGASCPLCTDDTEQDPPLIASAVELPQSSCTGVGKVCLVLDIDGTMLSESVPEDCTADEMRAYLRPHLDTFLDFAFDVCGAVGIWTAACDEWLQTFLRAVDPHARRSWAMTWTGERVSHRLSSRHISDFYPTRYKVKRLSKVWRNGTLRSLGYDRRSTLIIENTPSVCDVNYGNAIYVETYGNAQMPDAEVHPDNYCDDCLLVLRLYLESLIAKHAQGISLRFVEKRHWYAQTKLSDTSFE